MTVSPGWGWIHPDLHLRQSARESCRWTSLPLWHSWRVPSVNHFVVLLQLAGCAALATACHPGEPTSAAEFDVVATAHDDTVNFGNVGTFVMPDSVVAIVPPESA